MTPGWIAAGLGVSVAALTLGCAPAPAGADYRQADGSWLELGATDGPAGMSIAEAAAMTFGDPPGVTRRQTSQMRLHEGEGTAQSTWDVSVDTQQDGSYCRTETDIRLLSEDGTLVLYEDNPRLSVSAGTPESVCAPMFDRPRMFTLPEDGFVELLAVGVSDGRLVLQLDNVDDGGVVSVVYERSGR